MVRDIIHDIFHDNSDLEPGDGSYWDRGSVQLRDRIALVAEACVARFPGSLVEIGCYKGETTVRQAKIAQKAGRRVVCVDPWQPGTQNYDPRAYAEFAKRLLDFHPILDLLRLPSQDPKVLANLSRREICFAFVDGLHTYEGCFSDIAMVLHSPVVAVDDISTISGVRKAFDYYKGIKIYSPKCREGYIVT